MYLVTLNSETEDAVSRLVSDSDIQHVMQGVLFLNEGESLLFRRADYMNDFEMDDQSTGRPHLFLVQGSMSGRMYSDKPNYEEVERG